MHIQSFFASIAASVVLLPFFQASTVLAGDISQYQAGANVSPALKNAIEALMNAEENVSTNDPLREVYATNATLTVGQTTAVGIDAVVALKDLLMPTTGDNATKFWCHQPKEIFSFDSSSSNIVVLGSIQIKFNGTSTTPGVTCSDYMNHLVYDEEQAKAGNFLGNLIAKGDMTSASKSPTDVECPWTCA